MAESPVEKDMASVAAGLKQATEGGLPTEFVLWFGYEMDRNNDVQAAVRHALYEWDL